MANKLSTARREFRVKSKLTGEIYHVWACDKYSAIAQAVGLAADHKTNDFKILFFSYGKRI